MKRITRTYSGTMDPAVSMRENDHKVVARKAAAEGMVLLKNQDHALPLAKGSTIALYGGGASMTIKGGTGSGDVNERSSVNILEGLENAGFVITTKQWINDYTETFQQARLDWKNLILEKAKDVDLNEFFGIYSTNPFAVPAGRLVNDQDVANSNTDTAIYVISRVAGEGADRMSDKGDYFLSDTEKDNLDFICSHYAKVILVLNAGAQVDLSFADDYDSLKSILYMVQAGMEGGNALADLLCGQVTPSGKLTDTWARDYKDYPSSATFSHNNGNIQQEAYEEGIYVGYRYFDSFGIFPQYPFGFGLSYTDFAITPISDSLSVNENKQTVSIEATVKNTGNTYSGKEVVQVYASCPQGSIPKEWKRLCGFAKTSLLAPGQEETVKITFPVKSLASFDESKTAWIAESGLYAIWVGNSSTSLALSGALEVAETSVVESVAPICPLQVDLKELVRPDDKALAFEKSWTEQVSEANLPVVPLAITEQPAPAPYTCETLEKGKEIAAKATNEELIHMVMGEISKGQGSDGALGAAGIMVPGAAGETSSILDEQYGIPGLPMADGPAGLRLNRTYEVSKEDGTIIPAGTFAAFENGFFAEPVIHENVDTYYQYCTAIPVGALLAQTWDETLIQEVGAMVGQEMLEFGVTWWLAPGMNIHRNPLCGRNFEYYSEDPVVAGKIAAAMTKGVQSVPGVGTTIKHFACNNQEDNRMGSNSIVSQRTLRELYLRGFEIAIGESQPMAIMTSYNLINGVHAANNYDLCTQAARKEWGFAGIIMTDWTTTSPMGGSQSWNCITAGNDLIMPGASYDLDSLHQGLANGSMTRADLEACVARIISIALQSNNFEGVESYSKQFDL